MTPEEIKEIRQKLNLTQKEFAKLINCPLATLQGWEQGRHRPSGVVERVISSLDKKGK
jgi:putative transcriptional regulator